MTGPMQPPPEAQLMQMIMGKFLSKSITVAADLAVADQLASGPRSAEALAAACDANPDALYRMLRALAAVGVFEELPGREFRNNVLSEKLRSDVAGSMRAMARWIGHDAGWRPWGELGYSVRTGEPALPKVFGMAPFEYLTQNEDAARVFNEAMTSGTEMTGHAVLEAYDFSAFGSLVDVGGGHGALALRIKRQSPKTRVTVFDLPSVIEGTCEILAAADVAGQVETAAGSFFDGVPGGADAYTLKHILHDWSDEACVRILGHCRSALNAGGRVLIVEAVLGDGPESVPGKFIDLEMLVMTEGGRERTAAEWTALLEHAGLRLERIMPTHSHVCIVEASAG